MKSPPPKAPDSILRNPIHFLAFGFGSGLLPKIPGTWGTIAAIPIYLLLAQYPLWFYICITLLFIGFAIYAAGVTANDLGVHDHSGIVIDEIVGYLVTMIALPVEWFWIIAGFVLFRIFDIWKPWPIRWVDTQVKGGLGIVLDDLLAGIYTWIVLEVALCIWVFYS